MRLIVIETTKHIKQKQIETKLNIFQILSNQIEHTTKNMPSFTQKQIESLTMKFNEIFDNDERVTTAIDAVRSIGLKQKKEKKVREEESKYKRFKTEKNISKIIKLQRLFRINSYINKIKPKIETIMKRSRSEFVYEKTLFGIDTPDVRENLKIAHNIRQTQMKEGDIAQIVLGNFYEWEDLGIGHGSGLDIRRTDNSAIIELKNKWNTCNSSSAKAVNDKLSVYKKKYPNTRCIWGVINPKDINKNNSSNYDHDGVTIEKLQGDELLDYIFTYKNYNYKKEILDYILDYIKEISNSL